MRLAPAQPGIERLEAAFGGVAYRPHRHDTYAIGMTLAGVQSFDYRGARADARPGDVIILHPDELHDGRAGAAGGFRYRMLYLAPEMVREALGRRARCLPFAGDAVHQDLAMRRALALALGDLARPLEPLQADAAVLAVAEALLRHDPGARGRPARTANVRAVARARDYLRAHPERGVGSAELEAASGLGRYELARQFRAQLGTSPYRYLVMRRLERARAAILGGAGLAEAAASAGFADQSHMTRQFGAAYGLSPGRWRALALGDQAGSS